MAVVVRRGLAALLMATTAFGAEERRMLAVVRQDPAGDADVAAAAKSSKMAAVKKAITMLEDLKMRVSNEGEKEAKAYEKFGCFCKDTTTEKLAAISTNEDESTKISADINDLTGKRDTHDTTISTKEADIEQHEKDMKEAKDKRLKERKVYETNSEDMRAALDALDGAIKSLKASKTPSFVQVSLLGDKVRSAVAMADALGFVGPASKKATSMFLQEVPTETYKFHSDDVITTLEGLQGDFRTQRDSLDKAEVAAQNLHDTFIQDTTGLKEAAEKDLEKAQQDRAEAISSIETASQNLGVVSAELLADKEYANKLSKMCADKAKTWDQRSQLRADELSALSQAIAIVQGTVSEKTSGATLRFAQQGASVRVASALAHDGGAMDSIEAEAEAADATAFVQLTASKPWHPMKKSSLLLSAVRQHRGVLSGENDGRRAAADVLFSRGFELKSALLTSLAREVGSDPLAKVKTLIQDLIERLLQEASAEATQKGWCDKAMSDAKQKRDYAQEEIRAVNSAMAELEARVDKLTEEYSVTVEDIQELKDKRKEAEDDRAEEKTVHAEVIKEAKDGLSALQMAIDLLDKFYKSAAKAQVELAQTGKQSPEDEAPDAGFEAGEAYTGAQDGSGGVLGMLDVMKADFERTVEETELAEEEAEQDHLGFMTETGKSLAEKEESEKHLKQMKGDAETSLGEKSDKLDSQTDKIATAVKELLELKPTCVDTAMSYEDRVAMRQDELEALKKAHCILDAYAEYGPDAAGSQC